MARTIKLDRIESDGRLLAAGAIRASSEDDLAAHWQLFLATAAQGLYVASYRGVRCQPYTTLAKHRGTL
jgi:hypothetical protein